LKLTDVSEVRTASIIRATIEAVRTSETFVKFNVTTRHYIPEDYKIRCLESSTFQVSLSYSHRSLIDIDIVHILCKLL
jgi:hypothetical protein